MSKITSPLHSLPSAEQLSPSLLQPLANSLASFFCQKIVALKESISSKLHGRPSPLDFDQPNAAELLSDFAPVTPAEVTRLHSISNKLSQLDYIQLLVWNHELILSLSSSPILQTANLSLSQAILLTNFKLALISSLLTKPGLSKSDTPDFRPIPNLDTIGKILERLALARLSPTYLFLPVSALSSLRAANSTLLKLLC